MTRIDYKLIDKILDKNSSKRENLIPILQDIQAEYKFLPEEALVYSAEKIGMSIAELYGVASFYHDFSMNEKGKYVIKICNGTACHVTKSDEIQEALYQATGMTPEEHISKDGLFTIQRVACLGACSLAPVLVVNDVIHPKMTIDKTHKLIIELKEAEGLL